MMAVKKNLKALQRMVIGGVIVERRQGTREGWGGEWPMEESLYNGVVVVGTMRDDGSDCFPGSTQVTAAALDRGEKLRRCAVGVRDACQGCHPGNELSRTLP